MPTLVRYGTAGIQEDHYAIATYSGFSGTPVVVGTVSDTRKNGATCCIKKITPSMCIFRCFYNAGIELREGVVQWHAIGPTAEVRICGTHKCLPDIYY